MSKEYKFNSFEDAWWAIEGDERSLKHVRPDLITYKMAMRAIKDWGWELEYVPAHLITPELALEAVKGKGWNLEHVPAHCQTKEVIEMALRHLPYARQFIKVKEMFKNALEEALDE